MVRYGLARSSRALSASRVAWPFGLAVLFGEPLGGVLGRDADRLGEDLAPPPRTAPARPPTRPRAGPPTPARTPAMAVDFPLPGRADQHVERSPRGHHLDDGGGLLGRQHPPGLIQRRGTRGPGEAGVDAGAVGAPGRVDEPGLGVEDLDGGVDLAVPGPQPGRPVRAPQPLRAAPRGRVG